ncbi:MAG TPA: isochorismatase family cysteine hydrolase [Aggregatilineaceae bacterium]|nr:isochorismatase family cysteine hydrolase [Aggregatilineaceae bacterium]
MAENTFTEAQVLAFARQAYNAPSNPSFEIVPERCALLVIDMQEEFVKPGWSPCWVPEATRQVPRIRSVMDCCRERNIPVIFTVFSHTHELFDRPASGPYMPNRYPDLYTESDQYYDEGRVWHELAPLPGEVVIHKPSYGAFYDTPLETILKRMNKDTVIICGTLTNYCCGTTARQAYERSFKVVFGSDITATDDPEMQEPELKVLRKGFAKVLSCAEILTLLSS